jgi:hypothetical protein
MWNLLVQIFRRILRTSISLSPTVRLTAHLTRRRSRRLMSLTYFREISCRTLSWWVRWALIRVLGPPVPNMMFLARHRTTLLVRPPECPRRKHRPTQDTSALAFEIRPRDTYNPSLIRRIIHRRWCIFFQRLLFIYLLYFLIYGLKFNFPYLYFDINFL